MERKGDGKWVAGKKNDTFGGNWVDQAFLSFFRRAQRTARDTRPRCVSQTPKKRQYFCARFERQNSGIVIIVGVLTPLKPLYLHCALCHIQWWLYKSTILDFGNQHWMTIQTDLFSSAHAKCKNTFFPQWFTYDTSVQYSWCHFLNRITCSSLLLLPRLYQMRFKSRQGWLEVWCRPQMETNWEAVEENNKE